MTTDEMRTAVAKWMGWEYATFEEASFSDPSKTIQIKRWKSPFGHQMLQPPDYPSDLNAMHDVWLKMSPEQQFRYANELELEVKSDYGIDKWALLSPTKQKAFVQNATSQQRLRSTYRTLWPERFEKGRNEHDEKRGGPLIENESGPPN